MPKASAAAAPIMANEQVLELLSVLKENKSPSMNEFMEMLGHVNAMEKQLEQAVKELAAMRRDLAEAERRNHPVRNALRKAVAVMQAQVLELRDKLGELKRAVIDGCKNALQAFQEKGISALDNIARFFKVRPILEAIHTGADKALQSADRAVSNIGSASVQYHEIGRNIKNMGRALSGKEEIQDAKPTGKAAKTFTAPFYAVGAACRGIRNHAVAAVSNLKRLEERAAAQKKPSVKKTMEKYNEQIEREARTAPKRARSKPSPEL
jgi:hypothetical protein